MLPTISRAILGGQQAQVLSCKISELTSEQTVSFPAARARVMQCSLPPRGCFKLMYFPFTLFCSLVYSDQ